MEAKPAHVSNLSNQIINMEANSTCNNQHESMHQCMESNSISSKSARVLKINIKSLHGSKSVHVIKTNNGIK